MLSLLLLGASSLLCVAAAGGDSQNVTYKIVTYPKSLRTNQSQVDRVIGEAFGKLEPGKFKQVAANEEVDYAVRFSDDLEHGTWASAKEPDFQDSKRELILNDNVHWTLDKAQEDPVAVNLSEHFKRFLQESGGAGGKFNVLTERFGWPPWHGPHFTYKISAPPTNSTQYEQFEVELIFAKAFGQWSSVSPLTFERVEADKEADIEIKFVEAGHQCSVGLLSPGIAGHVEWVRQPKSMYLKSVGIHVSYNKTTNLHAYALHDIGMALNMRSSGNVESVMFPIANNNTILHKTDIDKVQKIYGNATSLSKFYHLKGRRVPTNETDHHRDSLSLEGCASAALAHNSSVAMYDELARRCYMSSIVYKSSHKFKNTGAGAIVDSYFLSSTITGSREIEDLMEWVKQGSCDALASSMSQDTCETLFDCEQYQRKDHFHLLFKLLPRMVAADVLSNPIDSIVVRLD